MNQVRKQFVLFAVLAIFVLLTVLLFIINGLNFTMAAQDADRVTQMLASNPPGDGQTSMRPERFDDRRSPMGPDSPDMNASVRYFVCRFDKNGAAELAAWRINAFSEDEALALAQKLKGGSTGWTNLAYRYRVYKQDGATYVIVIDQGRELRPCYRILTISLIGEVVSLAASFVFLLLIGKRLFRPLEEADRKQKRFMAEAESEFKVPLTVIHAQTELIEKETGSTSETKAIHRQVGKMTELIRKIGSFGLFGTFSKETCDLSAILSVALEKAEPAFTEKGVALARSVEENVSLEGDCAALEKLVGEVIANARLYAVGDASFILRREEGHVLFLCENGADLPDGEADSAFDRFTRLSNAGSVPGSGLGLSYVKEIVRAHNGRLHATVKNGRFTLSIVF